MERVRNRGLHAEAAHDEEDARLQNGYRNSYNAHKTPGSAPQHGRDIHKLRRGELMSRPYCGFAGSLRGGTGEFTPPAEASYRDGKRHCHWR